MTKNDETGKKDSKANQNNSNNDDNNKEKENQKPKNSLNNISIQEQIFNMDMNPYL